MTIPIDRDINAFREYLIEQVPTPSAASCAEIQRYQKAWKRYGYDAMDAARALEWYRHAHSESCSSYPRVINLALSVAVQHAAAENVQFGVQADKPCATCQHLGLVSTVRGYTCDCLLIWVAEPETSTCPEHTPTH